MPGDDVPANAETGGPDFPLLRTDKRGQPFSVRPLASADHEELERFYLAFEPKRSAQGLPPIDLLRIRRWLDAILPSGFHLVAFRDGSMIGHAFVVPTGQPGVGEYAIFLASDERGQGVGTELNLIVIERARTRGLRRIWLSVTPGNRAAIRSYEKAGFRFIPTTIFTPEAEMELEL